MKNNIVGLFFGSFNPVHVGHMIIANYMATKGGLSEVWMVVSPQSPFKKKKSLANDYERLHMVQLAIGDITYLRASSIEFGLTKPSYTVDTLVHLNEKYPNREFALIMGGDNLASLHKWKNYEILLRDYQIYVYQRPGYELGGLASHPSVHIVDAPLMYLSASYIRKAISEGFSVKYLVPESVHNSLEKTGLYK